MDARRRHLLSAGARNFLGASPGTDRRPLESATTISAALPISTFADHVIYKLAALADRRQCAGKDYKEMSSIRWAGWLQPAMNFEQLLQHQ